MSTATRAIVGAGALLLAGGCEAFLPPPPTHVPIPPPTTKARLEAAELDDGVNSVLDGIYDCYRAYLDQHGAIAHVTIAPSGAVEHVTVSGPVNLSQRLCMERDMRLARFPAFAGPTMTADVELMRPGHRKLPFTYRRHILK